MDISPMTQEYVSDLKDSVFQLDNEVQKHYPSNTVLHNLIDNINYEISQIKELCK